MDKDIKNHLGDGDCSNEQGSMDRRGFLLGLRKWSKIVIGGALLGSALLNSGREKEAEAAGWVNHRGGGGAWANRAGGGGAAVGHAGAWANRAGGGGAWANRAAAWANRGGSWVNRF